MRTGKRSTEEKGIRVLNVGAELRFVQDWLGHSNIQNTVIYTALVSTSREEKARQYFLKLPRL